jgi:putative Ca2+/H+ antiporter (TMEM165/GDT1 family)
LEALSVSTLAVAIAEIGDKTQLLSLLLVARYGRPGVIALGILLATVANHALAAWVGVAAAHLLDPVWTRWLLVGAFLAMALWILVPDDVDEEAVRLERGWRSVLTGTVVLFFLAEMADKTQVATVVLGARYEHALLAVVTGTTLGMLIANVPVLYGGDALFRRVPLAVVRVVAAVVFALLALVTALFG